MDMIDTIHQTSSKISETFMSTGGRLIGASENIILSL